MKQVQIPIQPQNSLILGLQEKTNKKTASGLILPETAQKRTSITQVLAVGPDVERVNVGERILFKEYTQHEISYDGTDYVLIEENDVLAMVEAPK
jgi:chaperonin GroES